MAENYTIAEATIVSIADTTQVPYTDKETGQPKVFTKFEFECQVGDEVITLEGQGFNRDKLQVGNRYSFEVQGKDEYTDSIRRLTFLGAGQAPTPQIQAAPEVKPHQTAQTAPPVTLIGTGPKQTPTPKPDLASRWREYNTNARTSQMQATERVGKYINLLIAGKLLNDAGETVEKVRKSTVENWYSEELDRFWREHDVRVVQDNWGRLDGSSGREDEVS